MNSNEHVRPFAFPEPGKGLKSSVNVEHVQPDPQFLAGRSQRRQQGSGRSESEKGRLRQFVRKKQPESDDSGETVLRPAFAVAPKEDRKAEASQRGSRLRRKGFESLSVRAENESGAMPGESNPSDLLQSRVSDSDLQSPDVDVTEGGSDSSVDEVLPSDQTEMQEGAESRPDIEEDSVAEAQEAGVPADLSAAETGVPSDAAQSASDQGPPAEDVGMVAPSAAATLQKALDDMFQKGLEQGRQDALKNQADGVHQQAFEQGVESGRQAGYEDGLQQGLAAAADEIGQRFAGIEALVQAMENHRRLLSHQQVLGATQLLERLVMEVVRMELRHSPEQIRAVVEEAVHLLDRTEHESIALRVHPDDVLWLQDFVDNSREAFVVRPDSAITRGGCRIEGRLGHVDATLEERLTDCIEQLRTCLLEDPQEASPVDISPIYDSVQEGSVAASSGRRNAESEWPPSGLSVTAQKSAATVSDSFFGSGASGQSELGAWGNLGQ